MLDDRESAHRRSARAVAQELVVYYRRPGGQSQFSSLLALQGVFMYSLAYFAVSHAETHVPSGLVAAPNLGNGINQGPSAERPGVEHADRSGLAPQLPLQRMRRMRSTCG